MKTTGSRCYPDLLYSNLARQNDTATLIMADRQDSPARIDIDVQFKLVNPVFNVEEYLVNHFLVLAFIHAGISFSKSIVLKYTPHFPMIG